MFLYICLHPYIVHTAYKDICVLELNPNHPKPLKLQQLGLLCFEGLGTWLQECEIIADWLIHQTLTNPYMTY